METMEPGVVTQEHHRAFAGHKIDTMFAADSDRRIVHRAGTSRAAMHPDVKDVCRDALIDDLGGVAGLGEEQSGIDGRLDIADMSKAALAFQFRRARIHRDNIVTLFLELAEYNPGEVAGITRNAYDGQSLAIEEIIDRLAIRDHVWPPKS